VLLDNGPSAAVAKAKKLEYIVPRPANIVLKVYQAPLTEPPDEKTVFRSTLPPLAIMR